MNLLMITSDRTLAAGGRGAFFNTLSELHKHFDRIDVICPNPSIRHSTFVIHPFSNVFVHPSPWPLVFQWFWIYYKGRQIIRHSALDIRHSLMTVQEYAPVFYGLGAWLLSRSTGVPYLLEVMHVSGIPRASGPRERLYRWLLRTFIALDARPARAVRVINRHEVPEFLAAAGVPRDKLVYIPAFYVDLDVFTPQDVPKQYDLVFVGRLARNKGLDLFLEVVRRSGLTALVVGDGPLLHSAKLKAQSYKLKADFVGFAKDSAEVAGLINRSRLLVMTSLSEGGPRVVLEAMACGVPVLATPVGIVPDVLPPECIEEWNAADLAAKAKNLLSDPQLYERVRQAGLFTVRQFERTAAIKEYADKLKQLAS